MKKNVFFILIFLIIIGVWGDLLAAPASGKRKKKSTTAEAAANADSIAAANAAADSIARLAASAAAANTVTATADADTSAPIPYSMLADSAVAITDNFSLDSTRPVDGFYKQTTLRGAKPFMIPTTSINNIKKYKRIWRQIDLNDSVNAVFKIPDEELMRILVEAVKAGKIIAYKDDEFKKAYTYNEMMKQFVRSIEVPTTDSTGATVMVKSQTEFKPASVKKYEIKEDLYFDKVHGKLITEIISFAPVTPLMTSDGSDAGTDTHPFYLNFVQLRRLLAGREVTDLKRDISNMSYDDLLITGNFHSQIIKEANPADKYIKDIYPDPADQLKESQRIEQEIRNYQKSLWKY